MCDLIMSLAVIGGGGRMTWLCHVQAAVIHRNQGRTKAGHRIREPETMACMRQTKTGPVFTWNPWLGIVPAPGRCRDIISRETMSRHRPGAGDSGRPADARADPAVVIRPASPWWPRLSPQLFTRLPRFSWNLFFPEDLAERNIPPWCPHLRAVNISVY